jgi:hypothetical protein
VGEGVGAGLGSPGAALKRVTSGAKLVSLASLFRPGFLRNPSEAETCTLSSDRIYSIRPPDSPARTVLAACRMYSSRIWGAV